MSENHPFRPITDAPPSPYRQSYILDGSPTSPPPHHGNETLYAEDDEVEPGFVSPSHNLHPLSSSLSTGSARSTSRNPMPNLEDMPPGSYLPPGAAAPQRYYAPVGGSSPGPYSGNIPQDSFASGSQINFHPNDLTAQSRNDPNSQDFDFASPRPRYAGYRDSDYDSVTRLKRESVAGSMTTFDSGGAETPRMSSVGSYPQLGKPYRDYDTTLNSQGQMDSSMYPMEDLQHANAKRATYIAPSEQKRKRIRFFLIGGGILAAIIIAAAVVVYFVFIRKHNSSGSPASSGTSTPTPSATSVPAKNLITIAGGDGSTLTYSDGTTGTYVNSFGGTWYYDPDDPFNMSAQAQNYSPPLNTTFRFGVDKVYGVNLGGWLNTEPFISPALYEKYLNSPIVAIDEWTLSQNLATDTAGGGFQQLIDHYETFITEQDFAQIAAAGLNFVRIPIPYWAITKFDSEPFLSGVQWQYVVKAIQWARKYGIRINLDLHALPGSQNGFNHAGKLNALNWLAGTMGIANAQRGLEVIRTIAEFISQPQYQEVVAMFGLVNEPVTYELGLGIVGSFYYQAHQIIRNITGLGTGKGPWITIHDGFVSMPDYTGFLQGADRLALDTHPYLCFQALQPVGPEQYAQQPCGAWGSRINTTWGNFGFVHAGEWSLGYTDCGLYLNGVGLGTRYEGNYTTASPRIGSCADVVDWPNWNQTYKQGLLDFGYASADVLQNWFFWTWKIGNSSVTGKIESPHWSYQLGLQEGFMPKDPRTGYGTCAKQGKAPVALGAPLQGPQTGGPGAGTFPPAQISLYGQWPPSSLVPVASVSVDPLPASGLPIYVQTGAPITLSAAAPQVSYPSYTPTATVDPGDGWADANDNVGAYVPIQGCNYPDPWNAINAPPPNCTPSLNRRRVPLPDGVRGAWQDPEVLAAHPTITAAPT